MKKLICVFQILFICLFSELSQAESFARAPDAILATKSLSKLPKDIIKIPILKDLLTENFVFYYNDEGADWLSFKGALARIAFEQKTDWSTQLISWLMNGPAELALWKGSDGKLRHFMVVIDKTGVKTVIESMLKISGAGDSQLKPEATDKTQQVQVLQLATGRNIYIASQSNLLFIYSDLSMPLPTQERSLKDRVMSFLGTSDQIGVFGPKLTSPDHLITVNAKYLSFGYQSFFESIKAFQFQYGTDGWNSRVLTSNEFKMPDVNDWSQLPSGAAFCGAVPINKKKIESIMKLGAWFAQASDSVLGCWYPGSKFYTPVFALYGDYAGLLKNADELKAVFSSVIGSREAMWQAPATEGDSATLIYKDKLNVKVEKKESQVSFIREVGGRYGLYASKTSKDSSSLMSKRFFRVKLSVTPHSIVFSPDDQLVDKSLKTIEGKFPSMAALLTSKEKIPSIFFSPDSFSKLGKSSILDSLPAAQEAIFRESVSKNLFPNFDKFAKRPQQTASLGSNDSGPMAEAGLTWKKLEWVTHEAK